MRTSRFLETINEPGKEETPPFCISLRNIGRDCWSPTKFFAFEALQLRFLIYLVIVSNGFPSQFAVGFRLIPGNHSQPTKPQEGSEKLQPIDARVSRFLFGLTIFVSAFLLFQVQLLLGKFLLPWFGGTAAVWTTCLLFFQLFLLAGYLYAHRISNSPSLKKQGRFHLGLIAISLPGTTGGDRASAECQLEANSGF